MLQFDDDGYLVPDRNIQSNLNELEKVFKINHRRNELFELYSIYNTGLKKILVKELRQWVDGSYVTKKEYPNDIDVVTFIDHEDFIKFESQLKDFTYPNSKKEYNIDGYIIVIYPEDSKKSFFYKSDYAYWLQNFSKDSKTNSNKGFLEVII